ncbi:MAG TPA: type II toxin-antitoxin system RelB/DinJ family antitoxin [Kiritimatiellia bacterium]|nr:type II toxin-antitoxin system RelB/DinJ family antitoxin [Kiritimatiellia bacterium]HRU70904.1 type II toxin-antitoxin system RelB/DinJ family antitoxin [Kiritimatiellia bacterium]
MASTTVTIRIDEALKAAATAAFEGMGLSLANGISVYLTRVAATKSIPFKVEVPAYTPSPTFGLTGEAYKQQLLEAKQRILNGQYSEHALIEV